MTRESWRLRRLAARARTKVSSALGAAIMMLCALASPAAAPEAPKPAPEVASAPSSGNSSIPPVVNKALDTIQSEGFMGSIIVIQMFVIAVLGVVIWRRQIVMDRALSARDKTHAAALAARDTLIEKARDEWDTQLAALHESRISLLREVMTALSNTSAVMQVHNVSTAERTASSEKLADLLRDLISTSAASRQQFLGLAQNLESQGRTNTAALERLSYRLQAQPGNVLTYAGGGS